MLVTYTFRTDNATSITFNGCSYFFEICGDSAFCIETVENPSYTCHGLTRCGNGPQCNTTSDCVAGYDCVPYCGDGLNAGFCLAQCDVRLYDDDDYYPDFGGDMCWAPGYTYHSGEEISLTSEQNVYNSYIASKSSTSSSSDVPPSSYSASGFLRSPVVMGVGAILVVAGAALAVAMSTFKSKNDHAHSLSTPHSFQSLPDTSEDAIAAFPTYMPNGVELEPMPSSVRKGAASQL